AAECRPEGLRYRNAVVAIAAVLFASCNRPPPAEPAVVQAAPAPAPSAAGAVPHGDHNPHHGGVVMMKGDDLHYEAVLDPTGRAPPLCLPGGALGDRPDSAGTGVGLTRPRAGPPGGRPAGGIDGGGGGGVGRGHPGKAPAETTVGWAFAIRHEPYWIDLPFRS